MMLRGVCESNAHLLFVVTNWDDVPQLADKRPYGGQKNEQAEASDNLRCFRRGEQYRAATDTVRHYRKGTGIRLRYRCALKHIQPEHQHKLPRVREQDIRARPLGADIRRHTHFRILRK